MLSVIPIFSKTIELVEVLGEHVALDFSTEFILMEHEVTDVGVYWLGKTICKSKSVENAETVLNSNI